MMCIYIYIYIRQPLPELERVSLHMQWTNTFHPADPNQPLLQYLAISDPADCNLPILQSAPCLLASSYKGRTPSPQGPTSRFNLLAWIASNRPEINDN